MLQRRSGDLGRRFLFVSLQSRMYYRTVHEGCRLSAMGLADFCGTQTTMEFAERRTPKWLRAPQFKTRQLFVAQITVLKWGRTRRSNGRITHSTLGGAAPRFHLHATIVTPNCGPK